MLTTTTKKSNVVGEHSETTVREATLDLLRSLGVDTFFGNPGSTELPFLDRWPDDIRYILGLQEASVVAMADGYARATGKAAFVNLHSAAGLGHALGNVFTAYRNRAPMVITAGQQARELMLNLPYLGATNAAEFPKPYVKFSVEPARAEDVPAAIAQAYRIAMQRPFGPTFVSVPVDDWARPCSTVPERIVAQEFGPDPALIDQVAELIAASSKPVLVVGAEVDEENAGPALVALAERLNAAVMTAPFSARISFPEDHHLFSGFLPASPGGVSDALSAYDLVVTIGAPVFTYHVPGDSALMRSGVPFVQLTTDGEAAASAPRGLSVLGSLSLTLPSLIEKIPPSDRCPPETLSRKVAVPKSETISAQYLFHRLGNLISSDIMVMEESPSTRPIMQEHMIMREWGSFFTMASGGLGYGLPGAVGLALAQPDRKVLCLIGDGSFMYSPQALWTAVQHNLDLKVLIVNNNGYGAMRSFSELLQVQDVPGIELSGLDFLSLAKGMGCTATKVTKSVDLDDALNGFFASTGPQVLEVEISCDVQKLYE